MRRHSRITPVVVAGVAIALTFIACKRDGGGQSGGAGTEAPEAGEAKALDRTTFNGIAADLATPLFWVSDANKNGQVEPTEIAVLWGPGDGRRETWITKDAQGNDVFTGETRGALDRIQSVIANGHDMKGLDKLETQKRTAVLAELAQGRPTLIANDFSAAPEQDKAIVRHVLAAAKIIEVLYAKQNGVDTMLASIAEDDRPSRMLFFRNQKPWCAAPKTEKLRECTAIFPPPDRSFGLYPKDIQSNERFCEELAALPNAKELLTPFTVVTKNEAGELAAVPYSTAFAPEMHAVSAELTAAATAITSTDEAAFKAYLQAAAQAFLDNNWEAADEAWAAMNATNSKWYLRIGPDETYYEPCNRKAGFHVSFGRINQGSLQWQARLDPLKGEMEAAIAKMAGEPYVARDVTFHLPDFIDIIINAGDSRSPLGATVGQSLPNWGPVANEGRGRTVAMTNLYTDEDSKLETATRLASILCDRSYKMYRDDDDARILGTLLHEAAHNLGPAHEYKVNGKTDDEIFGGPTASMLEELKAQTAALYLTDWLKDKEVVGDKLAILAHVDDIEWAFGHAAQGMYTADLKPKAYSQLASIQLGSLMNQLALRWDEKELAANRTDEGCFSFDFERFPKVVDELTKKILWIKANGYENEAAKLSKSYVDGAGGWSEIRDTVVRDRWLRSPKASFVYSIRL